MKPFASIGSEINKVRERILHGAESLRPAKMASDVRDQRDRLLAKIGEQTFRLIAERRLVVPRAMQESVERLATLLGVSLPAHDASLVDNDSGPPRDEAALSANAQLLGDSRPASTVDPASGRLETRPASKTE